MKTFIKVKRGIISPEHYEAIGPAVWLFLYLIDRADFDSGTMYGYTDDQAAEDIGSKKRTIRSWRIKLQDGGYIDWIKKPYSINVTISIWDNPVNKWGKSDTRMSDTIESDIKSDIESDIKSDIESDIKSDIEPTRSDGTHHLITRLQTPDSRINNYTDAAMQKLFVTITGMLTFPSKSQAQDIERLRAIAQAHNGDAITYCARFFQEWRRRGYSKSNTSWLDWAIADDIPKQKAKGNDNRTATMDDAYELFLSETS